MKGQECKFVKYMEGSGKRFVIPVYQRNYDWKTENCKQLYDDLVKVVKEDRKSHFFGSIVSVFNPDSHGEEYLIIDGQQRLTTVTLLLLAMFNLLNSGVISSSKSNRKQFLYEEYLVDKWNDEVKLKPVKNDQIALGKLFSDKDEHIKSSNMTANYDYFYERIQRQEITVDELYEAICSLEIISILLNHEDDPQLIFESLNSTGLDLTEGDKIRNYILMGLPSKKQSSYYEKYWNKIELYTNYQVSAFVRDYLSVKLQSIPQQKKVYFYFKDFVESNHIESELLLTEMLAYAKRYKILLDGQTDNKKLNSCIDRLNRLETSVTRPYFLEVLRLYDENILTLTQVQEIFQTVESYLFRRAMCGLPTNALNKIFHMLHRDIVRYDGTEDNYVEKFKYALMSKKESARFPNDDEFITAFSERPVYLMKKNNVYILERFENFGTDETNDVYGKCDDGTYSIEHIMPRTLTPTWKRDLGENYEQIHNQWQHRIANLTLTAYNSTYSNLPFVEKKTKENGFEQSGIRMNIMWIAKKDKWTLAELEERNTHLMSQALQIWPAPVTAYKPQMKQLDVYSLADDEDLTGRQIASFTFKNTTQPVKNWKEMFLKVLQILCAEDKGVITKLAASDEKGIALWFTTDSSVSHGMNPLPGLAEVYVWTNNSTQVKLSILSRLFELYDEDPSNLVFYLCESKEGDVEEEEE